MTKLQKIEQDIKELKEDVESKRKMLLEQTRDDTFELLKQANWFPFNWGVHNVELSSICDDEFGKHISFRITFEDDKTEHVLLKL